MPKVDFSAYEGREQAYIKHCLLEEYLPDWGLKVGSQWDSLVYVDGFAGPWDVRSPDFADSSFGVAIASLDRVAKGLNEHRRKKLNVQCILVEQDKAAFKTLSTVAESVSRPGFQVKAISGEFIEQLTEINKIVQRAGSSPFKFVFLDPKGWSDIPMQRLRPFLTDRSCEVVVNLMTRFIIRFFDQPDRAESCRELFGRDDVLPIVQAAPPEDRQDVLVREYCKSLHTLCGFKYVSSAVILEPNRDDIRYFLVYGTNHHRGVEVFKTAERKAARLQDEIRHAASVQKSGQEDMMGTLFGGASPKSRHAYWLWERYCAKAKRKVIERILAAPTGGVLFTELFCDAMAFPLVTPTDLYGWIKGWEKYLSLRLEDPSKKKPSPDQNDWVEAKDRQSFARIV